MMMRLKEQFFTGAKDYTFSFEPSEGPPTRVTVVVDKSRYFEIDAIPPNIPVGLYAEFVKDAPNVH